VNVMEKLYDFVLFLGTVTKWLYLLVLTARVWRATMKCLVKRIARIYEKEGAGYFPRVRKGNRQCETRCRFGSDTTPGRNDQGDELGERGKSCANS
jgi:hypothetical protein